VRLVEASAFLDLTLPLVRYRVTGIRRDSQGKIVAPNRIIAKVSRVEVASKFLAPPPERILRELLQRGEISPEQAAWAARIPLAEDLTAEADSGAIPTTSRRSSSCPRCWPCATACKRSTATTARCGWARPAASRRRG